MSTIREVLYQHIKGNSQRQIARSFDLSRDTIRKYIELAKQDADAAKVLAVIYFKGLGPKKDISKGLESFEQAAMLGDRESMQFLAKFYSVKNSPFKDLEKARYYQLLLQDKGVGNNNNLPISGFTL